jgi:hypothetical protein
MPHFSTLRLVTCFVGLYLAVLVNLAPALNWPGVSGLLYLCTGFLIVFPIDRVRSFYCWASESLKLTHEYRTCVVTTPRLQPEQREWRYIGAILEKR